MERNLIAAIWELYHIDDEANFKIGEIEFNFNMAEYLKDQYSLEERTGIYDSLVWAKNRPDYDYKTIMVDVPLANKIRFTN